MSRHVGTASWPRARVGAVLLRGVVVAGLAVDVYVHLHLAAGYDANTAAISEGALFRVEAGVAALAALLVLLTRTQIGVVVAALAALVLLSPHRARRTQHRGRV